MSVSLECSTLNILADDIIADRFVMPALLGTFMPPDQQCQNFAFNVNTIEGGTALDEWMLMNGSGMGW